MRSLRVACAHPLGLERAPPHKFVPRALPRAHARSLWKHQILHGKRHVCAPLGMCAICLARAPSVWLAHTPSGMCPLRLACTRSSSLVRLPIGPRVLLWACHPSDSHARTPLGLKALGLARARYVGHVRTPFGMCALPLGTPNFARKPQILCGRTQIFDWKPQINPRKHKFSLGNVCPPFGTRVLPWACEPSVWHARRSFGLRTLPRACAPSVWHARAHPGLCTFRLACARSLGHAFPPIGMRAPPWA